MEKKLVKIGEAAKILGTCVNTLRGWEASGELVPTRKTQGGTRYYSVAELMKVGEIDAPTVCYARVSSHDQKEDLQTTLNKILDVLIEIRNHVTGTQN